MAAGSDLDRVKEQERVLVFPRFDEAEAFSFGSHFRELALSRGLPIIIEASFWDRLLFYSALPGSTAGNREWARRKVNSVRLYQKSTYRMFIEQGSSLRVFGPDFGHDPRDHAIAGGAFPIRVEGLGAVGAIAVSGLPHLDDHNLVVEAIATYLGIDHASVALVAEGA